MKVGRTNGDGTPIPGEDIKINFYTAEHTYPGIETYTLSFNDPNRVSDIINLNFPNSVDIPFYVQTTFTLLNSQFQGLNSSARLLQPPIDFGCIFQRFEHNPNAYDPDGDSLAYELITPFEDVDEEVPNYVLPNTIAPGINNNLSLNELNGDFIWDAPQAAGEYSIAILIKEYREGVLINSTVRDMQIFVAQCNNRPPVISSEKEICVVAGTVIEFPVLVNDPDSLQLVRLTATGGPFELDYFPASLSSTGEFMDVPFSGTFRWETQCEHISDQAYQIVFRAQDNFGSNELGLADLQTVSIKVVGPAPEEVTGEKENDAIRVEWKKPYECEASLDSFFIGFSVWRRNGSNPFEIDTCMNGLEGRGYEKVKFLTNDFENDRYFFVDENIQNKGIYCYRVLAQFALRTENGFAYNVVESLASEEVCLNLSADLPLITNVSVESTDINNGDIQVRWIKPDTNVLDTIENPGPYRYQLMRSSDGINFEPVIFADFQSQNFSDPFPLEFLDQNRATSIQPYTYHINFYSNNLLYGTSEAASSVFLNVIGKDEENILSWTEQVPWENFAYNIYRQNDAGVFDSIAQVESNNYLDLNLINGKSYCYYIEAIGTYGIMGIPSPLINLSQEFCAVPTDSIPPCTPSLEVENPCDQLQDGAIAEAFFNTLFWSNPSATCEKSQDLAAYHIYYAPTTDDTLELLLIIDNPDQTRYEHIPELGISGCYAIAAADDLGNLSALSNVICVDNCPAYLLPNTFTPNGDGANEFFTPIVNRFVESVDFKVFNRWGNLLWETSDHEINWDGKDTTGKTVDDGVYYYSCDVFEKTVNGTIEQRDVLSGFIQVLKN